MNDIFSKVIEERLEAERRNAQTINRGRAVQEILESPVLAEFFKSRAASCFDKFIHCPDSELSEWRSKCAALLQLHADLITAVTQGKSALNRMAEQADHAQASKE